MATPSHWLRSCCNYPVSLPCEFTRRSHVTSLVLILNPHLIQPHWQGKTRTLDLSFLVHARFQAAEKLEGQETMDGPHHRAEGDLDSDNAPRVCLPWVKSRIFFFFEQQTGSGLRNPFLPSHEAWVASALFFSIFRGTPVVEGDEVRPQGRGSSHPGGYHSPAPLLGRHGTGTQKEVDKCPCPWPSRVRFRIAPCSPGPHPFLSLHYTTPWTSVI